MERLAPDYKKGSFIFLALSLVTLVTLIIAFFTPPLSGPFCQADCYNYPFHNISDRFPRDYYWMYPAIVLNLLYIPATVFIYISNTQRKLSGITAIIFGCAGALLLVADYFVQVSVIQQSLINGETDGIAMLSQYNPHGLFIVIEELGFFLISLSFIFLSFLFPKNLQYSKPVKYIFNAGFIISLLSMIIIFSTLGMKREYVYEITVISIVWLVFIINGFLIFLHYSKNIA